MININKEVTIVIVSHKKVNIKVEMGDNKITLQKRFFHIFSMTFLKNCQINLKHE